MARPPQHLQTAKLERICRWQHPRGSRALYAAARGNFVQAQISGYSYKNRKFMAHDWRGLGFEVSRICSGWGVGWKLQGQGPTAPFGMPYAAGQMIAARAGQ